MRHALVLTAVLSGCFSPKFPEGLQCGTGSEPCPPGQSCVNGICRSSTGDGGVDVPTSDDIDGDLVPNEQDNCPEVFNPQQYDEEGDGVGNACDPNPVTFENGDRDGDGVGDAIDPFPDTPGERIVMFEGFDETLNGWGLFGNWAQGAGELVFELGNDQYAYASPPLSGDGRGLIIAGFVADVVDDTFINRGVGIGWLDPNAGRGVACTATVDPNQGHMLAILDHTTFQPFATTPAPWGVGTPEVLYHFQLDPTDYFCGITGTITTSVSSAFSGFVPENLGLGARSVSGRFLWMIYIDVP